MDQTNIAPSDSADVSSSVASTEVPLEKVCESIWKTSEVVLELLRSHSTNEIHARKGPDALWVDDVTRAQGNTVIAIKQLCDVHPEGVGIKKLAETIGVTAAAASVMVDLLEAKKMVKRTRSKNDRRALLVRLTPQTTDLFAICEESLGSAVMSVGDTLGPQILRDWEKILTTVSAVLYETLGLHNPPDGSDDADDIVEATTDA